MCSLVSGDCVIPYGKWHTVAVRWNSINSYTLPLPLHVEFMCRCTIWGSKSAPVTHTSTEITSRVLLPFCFTSLLPSWVIPGYCHSHKPNIWRLQVLLPVIQSITSKLWEKIFWVHDMLYWIILKENKLSRHLLLYSSTRLVYRVHQKSNPIGKTPYLWNCSSFFHQIYSIYRWGFRPQILQILLKLQMWFNRYNSLNYNSRDIDFFLWNYFLACPV